MAAIILQFIYVVTIGQVMSCIGFGDTTPAPAPGGQRSFSIHCYIVNTLQQKTMTGILLQFIYVVTIGQVMNCIDFGDTTPTPPPTPPGQRSFSSYCYIYIK